MAYVVSLSLGELSAIQDRLRVEQRLTKAVSKETKANGQISGKQIALLLGERSGNASRSSRLAWLGVVARHNTVGAIENSITIEPLRECFEEILIDGDSGFLGHLPELRAIFEQAVPIGGVGILGDVLWEQIEAELRQRYPQLTSLLDWLGAQATPVALDSNNPADRAWQEQRDATGTLLRIAEFPLSALAAWRRPEDRNKPYLAGVIPQPVEHSLIDHDIRVSGRVFDMTSEWMDETSGRCDIHVLRDTEGRHLEVVNVNATAVEARLGTDMIYYHAPTHSFILVQYKRLDPRTRSMYVDQRLMKQLDRLDGVAKLSDKPRNPSEWRLGIDSCFLKLAYWPNGGEAHEGLAPGMYLPISYVRMLLGDECTRGTGYNSEARILSYDRVERHLVGTQFVELVKHGLAGTVGTSFQQLRSLVENRAKDGQSVVLAIEDSTESTKKRQMRIRNRSPRKKSYEHTTHNQIPLFGLNSDRSS